MSLVVVVVNFQQIYLISGWIPFFPSTVRPIDGTQIRNQAPRVEEHGYVDRNFFSFLCAGEIIDVFEKETFLLSQ